MISYLLRWSSRCFLDSNFWIFFFFLSSGTFLLSFQFLREKLLLIKSCSRVEIRFKKWNSEETSTQFAIAFSSPLKCHIFQGITFVVSYEENICFIFLNLSFFFFFFKEKAPPFSNVLIFSRNSIKTIVITISWNWSFAYHIRFRHILNGILNSIFINWTVSMTKLFLNNWN